MPLLSFLLLLGVFTWLIETAPRPVSGEVTEASLAAAKTGLIAYAVTYGDNYGDTGAGPGHFPCPDTNGNGSPNPPCGPGTLGRMPLHTRVGSRVFPFYRETLPDDQRLWYRISAAFRNNPAGVVNSDTPGQLSVDGITDVVAVIIAPGPPLPHQKRPSNAVSDYLEGENADGDSIFSMHAGNDRILPILRSDFLGAVERRVAGNLRDLVREYRLACGAYPWAAAYAHPWSATTFDALPGTLEGFFPASHAAPVDWRKGCAARIAPPQWLLSNRWPSLSYYAVASAQVQAGGSCLPGISCISVADFNGEHSERAVVLLAGIALPDQVRSHTAEITEYFERENRTSGDNGYRSRAASPFNDQLLGVN